MTRLLFFLETRRKSEIAAVCFLLVAFFAAVDYATGPDLSVFIFYLVPVLLSTWFLGNEAGTLFAVLSALAWSLADMISSRTYSYAAIPYWNLVMEVAFFLVIIYILSGLKSALEQEKQLARSDYLTGAVNSRYFSKLAQAEIRRSGRYQHPFTVVYLDIDDFKTMNDRFGHSTGDALLRETARTMREHCRASDVIARLGGDEFALLFPETGLDTALIVINKLRTELAQVMQARKWPVTFSFGMVTFEEPPDSVDSMIALADEQMYEGKKMGKNAVRCRTYRESKRNEQATTGK